MNRPIHVVYGGAHLFKADVCRKLGDVALRALNAHAPDAASLAEVTGMASELAAKVYPRVVEKLRTAPVEDYRIDFEDGYGQRPDAEEDAHAQAAAEETSKAMAASQLPPFFGIRVKPLEEPLTKRALRTLRIYMEALGPIPTNFVITLPKITVVDQVRTLVEALAPYPGAAIELMVETPQSLFILRELVEAAQGRAVAAHFGPYDYTASLGIIAAHQKLTHPACDFARSMMQAVLAPTGLGLSDGLVTTLPVGTDRAVIHRAWKAHYDNVRRALDNGFYQGWDLHPAQLVTRYAAVYAFFHESLDESSTRLRNFVAKAAQATRIGDVFDDAATAQGLRNHFLRALHCGAIAAADVPALTGLTTEELRTGRFIA